MSLIIRIVLQTTLAFFVILVLTRLLGKQQIAQLTFYEYVNGITFGSIAANMATDSKEKLIQHLVGLIFFATLTGLMSFISMKNRVLRKIISGESVIVIQDGQILEDRLRKMRLNLDELMSELRNQGVFNPEKVRTAIVEPSGKLSVLLREEDNPVDKGSLGINSESDGINIEIIIDGQLIYTNLVSAGLDAKWLMEQLRKNNIKGIKDVAFASLNAKHQLYIDTYEDRTEGMIDASDGENIPFSEDQRP